MFSMKNFISGWNEFFYRKSSAETLCVFRMILGFLLVLNGVSLIEDFYEWFGIGDRALVPLEDSFTFYSNFRINLFNYLSPTVYSAWFILFAYILSSFTMMIGFWSRTSTFISFVLLVTLQNRNYAILNSGDTLLRCMLFPMIFAPTHVLFSVDCYLRKGINRPCDTQITILPLRLLQLQFSVVYLSTALFKLKGIDWVDGSAVYYTSRLLNFQRVVLPIVFDYPSFVKAATWSALFIEFAMGTLVWVKEFRVWVLAAGIILHLSIEISMSIGFFEWVMIAGYILFITPEDLKWLKLKGQMFYAPGPSV